MSAPEPSIDDIRRLYAEAVNNKWRTVEVASKQALDQHLASRRAAAEAAELMNISQQILKGEPTS